MIIARKGNLIVTESRGKRFVWEKVRSGKDHIIFQHFDGVLYARYDSYHTPVNTKGTVKGVKVKPGISIREWHAFQRAEAAAIIQGIMKDERKKKESKSKHAHSLVPAFSGV